MRLLESGPNRICTFLQSLNSLPRILIVRPAGLAFGVLGTATTKDRVSRF